MQLKRAINTFKETKERTRVKKVVKIATLTMTFVLATAMSAFAALTPPATSDNVTLSPHVATAPDYSATSAGTLYDGVDPEKYGATATPANPSTDWPAISSFKADQNVVGGAPSQVPDAHVPTNADGTLTQDVTRIHSNYTKNTNACAACHATHTAVGKDLLQWDGETETCMACHDGTAGVATYDVSSGHIGASNAITNGGVFPTGDQTSKSMHDVFGGVELTAAPGGNFAPSTTSETARWDQEFSCVSCHSPHAAGGNFRLLNNNVNGFGDLHLAGTYNATTKKFTGAAAMTNVNSSPSFTPPAAGTNKFAFQASFPDVYSGNKFWANFVTAPIPWTLV